MKPGAQPARKPLLKGIHYFESEAEVVAYCESLEVVHVSYGYGPTLCLIMSHADLPNTGMSLMRPIRSRDGLPHLR